MNQKHQVDETDDLAQLVAQVQHLRAALESRSLIGQAIGIIRGRYDLDEDRAFAVLQRVSSTRDTKIRVLAAEIVLSGDLPPTAIGELRLQRD